MIRTALFLTLLALPAAAAEPGAAQVMERVQAWLDGTEDLQGRFDQTMLSGALGSGLAESGRLWIERPGRMRWDYDDPEQKTALIVDRKTWMYIAEDRQLQLGSLHAEDRLLPALLAGNERLSDLFQARRVETPPEGRSDSHLLRLLPRAGDLAFEEMILVVRGSDYGIESAEVMDAAGNRIQYRFSELERNRGIPAERFRFKPPDGTEILGSH